MGRVEKIQAQKGEKKTEISNPILGQPLTSQSVTENSPSLPAPACPAPLPPQNGNSTGSGGKITNVPDKKQR